MGPAAQIVDLLAQSGYTETAILHRASREAEFVTVATSGPLEKVEPGRVAAQQPSAQLAAQQPSVSSVSCSAAISSVRNATTCHTSNTILSPLSVPSVPATSSPVSRPACSQISRPACSLVICLASISVTNSTTTFTSTSVALFSVFYVVASSVPCSVATSSV